MIFSLGAQDEPPTTQLEHNVELLVLQTMSRGGWPMHHLAVMWPHVMLPRLNDARLAEELRASHSEEQFQISLHYQMVLAEIIRRGDDEFQLALADDERRRTEFEQRTERIDFRTFAAHTALCRLQHKADPIEVIIEDGKQLECTFPDLSTLSVAIVNRDEQRVPVGIHLRNGRPEGWWLEVWDSSSNRMPVGQPAYLPEKISHPGYDLLKFGERRQEQRMLLCDRVEMLPPGQYKVLAYFSGEGEIERDQPIEELICSHSQALTLTVKPIVLQEDRNVRQHVRDLVSHLPERGPIKVVGGTYGSWAYQLVPPFSAQEQILRMGPRALPELLDMLEEDRLTPRRRAWVLSLLYSLTGLNDPTRRFEDKMILGGFKSVGYYWNVFGNDYRPCRWGGFDFPDIEPIDVEAQRRLAEQWKPLRQYIQVRK
jgi:hypothetical protein